MKNGPLSHIRVIDFSWVGAGSYLTRILGDLGADVVKVESSTRVDQIRVSPPFMGGVRGVDRSGYFADRNSSKRSITVNLKDPRGLELVFGLIEEAEIVANNFAPGVMDKLGLGYEAVRARRPDIVYVAMSMQGSDGPHAADVGYGLTIGALSGLHALVGEPGRPPIGTGTNFPDHVPSPGHAAFAVLCALRHRAVTGDGQLVELSQVEATIAMLGADVLAASLGVPRPPQANAGPGPVHDAYPTSGDDRWITISAQTETELAALARVLGLRPDDLDGPTASELIASRTIERDGAELMRELQEAGVKSGVVQTARDLIESDPQLAHRRHWVRLPREGVGDFLYNVLPFRLDDFEVAPTQGFPALGEHTTEVLMRAGYSQARLDELAREGVLS